jgi:hypothetical protein
MNTGSILAGRPSLGAWLTYGLGTANKNLPTFVVMQDDKEILGAVQNYGSGFLPATYQGSLFRQGDTPILNLKPPAGTTDEQQRSKLELLQKLNEMYGRGKEDDTELDARTRSMSSPIRCNRRRPMRGPEQGKRRYKSSVRNGRKETAVLRRQLSHGQKTGRTRRAVRRSLQRIGFGLGRPPGRQQQSHQVVQSFR